MADASSSLSAYPPLAEPAVPQGTWEASLGAIVSDKTHSSVPVREETEGLLLGAGIGGLIPFFVTAIME